MRQGHDLSADERSDLGDDGRPFANAELLLLPLAFGDARGLAELARNLSGTGLIVGIAPNRTIDPGCYDASRDQYRADKLVEEARRAARGHVLAVTEVDLYVPDLNFVFGMAPGRAAVVSVHRLRPGADDALLQQRLFKEAVHEIGHSFGLGHCIDRHCVMSFSNSVAEADRKSSHFCHGCRRRLHARGLK
jgi:archaemetzincin